MVAIAPPESAAPLNGEPLKSLKQIASRLPGGRADTRLHPATLTRWILVGVRILGGRRVRLEAVRVGNRWATSEAALNRFLAAITPELNQSPPPRRTRTAPAGKAGDRLAAGGW